MPKVGGMKKALEENSRHLLTLPSYLRPGVKLEDASNEDLKWLTSHYKKQMWQIESILEDRLYTETAPCGCRYRLVYEYGSRGEGADMVRVDDMYSQRRCEKHRGLSNDELNMMIASRKV